MACASKYFNIAAASISGAGSGLTLAVGIATTPTGAGIPVTIGGALGTLGSTLWLISAINDLIDCLKKKGKFVEAQQFQKKVDDLQRDVDRLKELIERLGGKAS
jgi:hypothetical protein